MKIRKLVRTLGVFILLGQQLMVGTNAFSIETTDYSDSPLELTVEGNKELSLTSKTQTVSVDLKDTTSSSDTPSAKLQEPVYAIWFPEGVSYAGTSSPISVETYQDHITFQFVSNKEKEASFSFTANTEENPDELKLQATRSGVGLDIQSNDLLLTPVEDITTQTTEEKSTDSSVKQSEESEKSEDLNEETESKETKEVDIAPKEQTARSLPEGTVLENGMEVSDDFADGITVDEYLAQYTFPHLPKTGVTDAYESTEVDLRTFAPSEIALVYDRATWNAAISNSSIKAISVVKSFAMTAAQSNSGTANRQLVIEGNGMLIDFRSTLSQITGANNVVTIQNLNMYHANYYGAVRPTATTSLLQFHNLNDYGSQIISSQGLPVKISGDFISRFTTSSYKSPIDGSNVNAQYLGQQNFESSNLEFLADSVSTLETYNGSNIDLTAVGDVVVYENAKLNLIAGNKAAAAGEGSSGFAISARYASNFIMEKNSEIDYTYTDPGNGNRNSNGAVYFNGAGTFTMRDGAKMNVTKDSHSGSSGLINFNQGGTFNLSKSSTIDMNVTDASAGAVAVYLRSYLSNYPVFNITDNSRMTVNMKSTGTGTNPIIDAGAYATVNIDSGSTLDIQTQGYKGNIINLGAGNASRKTSFTVGADAKLNVNAQGRTTSTTDVVNVGNYAAFKIVRMGSFKLSANMARYLFTVGTNSTFQFSDALLVDFGYTQEPVAASALINMSGNAGKFLIDIQRVKAWNRSNVPLNDDTPTYDWNPMFGMEIPYAATAVTSANIIGNSTTVGTAESFKKNFNTGPTNGFQRLLFEFIPDVKVLIENQPVDDPANENSKIIKGLTNAGAYVRITDKSAAGAAYSSFPASNNTVSDPTVGGSNPNYTVVADSQGYFEFEVPTSANVPFIAGSTISAYAFLNGKSDSTDPIGSTDVPEEEWDKVVSDKTAPTATGIEQSFAVGDTLPEAKTFVKDAADSNPNTTITASYKETNDVLNGYLSTVGDYDVTIILTDTAGNASEVSAKMHVFDTTAKIEGQDIELKTSEVDSISRTEFEERMKTEIDATAYAIVDSQYKNLDDKIVYDFSRVIQSAGVYTVTLSVPASESGGISVPVKTITVTIKSNGPTAPVDPDNPQEGTTPPEGTENPGTNATGDLRMDYAPSAITFGTVPFAYSEETYNATKPKNTNGEEMTKQWIQISDDRTSLNGWSVKVSQPEEFKDAQGNKILGTTLTIPKGIINNSIDGTIDTTSVDSKMTANSVGLGAGASATLFGAKDAGADSIGKKISTYQWDPTKVTLNVPGGKAKTNTAYETEINWSLVTEPTQ
ncbi:WxL domain-containing protein [Enterococcus phoeniculicola]|uniref:WxL domain-containing protein n=1 Tax=Enterococcus phoeniculicola ATCC BAA-412 TaxID=1158610 RepID=R3W4I6_9ENTE|nr:WxL domain-containing protein [Enterococcus phoeniculicola]EOL42522.1 hypothetical protein UC3_02874 [Enterococcus phoeniculicola ATCC BAA-412]EOT79199.1 hypothetical protein I589_00707 [Enterococcus phoeniculicola ATCC BAA-412]